MVELKNFLIFNPEFISGMNKLLDIKLPGTTTIKIVKLVKEIENQRKTVIDAKEAIFNQYKARVAGTEIVFDDEQESTKADFEKALDELYNDSFETSLTEKISFDSNDKISGNELLLIEPIIEV